ncbi:hypothetical protein H1R20_g6951, partial [Candolleomyces eurysporus]
MAAVIPETEPFIRDAVKTKPALLRQDEAGVSLGSRMRYLVYAPFRAAVQRGTGVRTSASLGAASEETVQRATRIPALARGPFLIVLDGLDECDNKDEVQELVDGMLAFFSDNPFIPLRVFIASRVEQHIQSHLNVPGVCLDNLVDHCSDDDIATFLDVLFKNEMKRNPVIRAYILEYGEWPRPKQRRKLVQHIGGSFIFASTVFKFIMGSTAGGSSSATPMDRLPLALKMNPGLDGLYAQTLARSQHLPHFSHIISTIALLEAPLPTSGIAELLGICTYKVVNVLVNLQAIIQVPGTDDIPVTLFHTSLRDFLSSQRRSGRFFAHPREHVRLFLRCLQCELVHRQHGAGSLTNPSERKPAAAYALVYSVTHLNQGRSLFKSAELHPAIQLCRETLELCPGAPELIESLARVTLIHAGHTGSLLDLEEAVSLYREVLESRPSSDPDRLSSLNDLGHALQDRYQRTRSAADLEETISLHREALELRPSPHPDRSSSLNNLGCALRDRYQRTGTVADLEAAISLHREALELQPSYLYHEWSLRSLAIALHDRYELSHKLPYLQEAIFRCEELLTSHYPIGHQHRLKALNGLASLIQKRFAATRQAEDVTYIARLKAEAHQLTPFTNKT